MKYFWNNNFCLQQLTQCCFNHMMLEQIWNKGAFWLLSKSLCLSRWDRWLTSESNSIKCFTVCTERVFSQSPSLLRQVMYPRLEGRRKPTPARHTLCLISLFVQSRADVLRGDCSRLLTASTVTHTSVSWGTVSVSWRDSQPCSVLPVNETSIKLLLFMLHSETHRIDWLQYLSVKW